MTGQRKLKPVIIGKMDATLLNGKTRNIPSLPPMKATNHYPHNLLLPTLLN
jgi:hypothetical protein